MALEPTTPPPRDPLDLRATPDARRQRPTAPEPKPPKPERPRRSRKRLVLIAVAALLLSPLLLIALGSFLPVYVSSYMLQSPTRPVQHAWVPRERIADAARRAVVAAEDQKFWNHHGFDMEAMQKAYERNQRGGRVRGGSTISQQTAKNLFLWPGGGYFRKGLEAGFTVVIEALWSKERILEVYLNSAEFGPGVYGVEAASQRFFHKPAAQLNSSEAARLAAVLPSPRRWKVDAPGPYVRTRTAWIQRQMGTSGRAPAVEEDEPDLPPGERFDEDEGEAPAHPAATPADAGPVPATPPETQQPAPGESTPEPAAPAESPAPAEPEPAPEPAAETPAEPAPVN